MVERAIGRTSEPGGWATPKSPDWQGMKGEDFMQEFIAGFTTGTRMDGDDAIAWDEANPKDQQAV